MEKQIASLSKLVERYELIATRMEAIASQKPELPPKPAALSSCGRSSQPSTAPPAHVLEYDNAIDTKLDIFNAKSRTLGGDCGQGASLFSEVFFLQRSFLWKAAGQPEPDQKALIAMLEPVQAKIQALGSLRDSKRNTVHFNHLSAMAEAIQAVGWVTVKPTPAPFIKEMIDAAKFYTNRVRKDHKDTSADHIEWVVSAEELLNELYTFVRKTHTTGLVWNSAPGSAPAVSVCPPPPPGPPPPPPLPVDLFKSDEKGTAGRTELFKELNQGEAITAKLKKVTAEMQTHKNPTLRGSSAIPSTTPHLSPSKTESKAPVPNKIPRKQLENGKQWTVEYFKNDTNITVDVTEKKETVYIYNCENCTIRINGKCNSITLDKCKKVGIACDAVVAQLETINCQSLQIQTFGEMPTVSIQKTDGCQIYLAETSKNAEIVTSKSSEMNVLIPEDNGEFTEMPLPEQFKTVYRNGKLETSVSDIC